MALPCLHDAWIRVHPKQEPATELWKTKSIDGQARACDDASCRILKVGSDLLVGVPWLVRAPRLPGVFVYKEVERDFRPQISQLLMGGMHWTLRN